jgi:hypothetical protein
MTHTIQSPARITVGSMPRQTNGTGRSALNPLADLVELSDEELRDLGAEMARLVDAEDADFARVRRLLADWARTVRIRRHPDFARNAAAFAAAMRLEEDHTAS